MRSKGKPDADEHQGEIVQPRKTYRLLGKKPTACTPEVIEAVAEIVSLGVTIPHACKAMGICASMWIDWNQKGREDIALNRESTFRNWVEALGEARAAATTTLIAKIALSPDWRAAAWLLEKLDKNFRPQPTRLEVSTEQKAADQVAGLSTGEIMKLIQNQLPANAPAAPAMLDLPAGENPKTDKSS